MSTRERSWPLPVALIALSAIPLTAGTLRLIQLAGGPAVIPADHRFASFPLPLVVHIVGATPVGTANGRLKDSGRMDSARAEMVP